MAPQPGISPALMASTRGGDALAVGLPDGPVVIACRPVRRQVIPVPPVKSAADAHTIAALGAPQQCGQCIGVGRRQPCFEALAFKGARWRPSHGPTLRHLDQVGLESLDLASLKAAPVTSGPVREELDDLIQLPRQLRRIHKQAIPAPAASYALVRGPFSSLATTPSAPTFVGGPQRTTWRIEALAVISSGVTAHMHSRRRRWAVPAEGLSTSD